MPHFMKVLNNVSRSQATFRADRLTCDGIGPCHHAFLLTVGRQPGLTQEAVARELCLNKSTVTRTLSHLESLGFIRRQSNPNDKREILVYPTEALQAMLPTVRAITASWHEEVTAGIPKEDLDTFFNVLQQLEQNAKQLIGANEL